ncbi:MAG TPA: hypothetical protein VKQ52_12570 [Puia sp.]|nr:hypothetical protein [Puia sp.]
MPPVRINNVTVTQMMGNHLVVLTAPTADYDVAPAAVGVIVNAALTQQNGGPVTGPFPTGNVYTVSGDAGGVIHQIPHVRYIGHTPGGNAQFTTQ